MSLSFREQAALALVMGPGEFSTFEKAARGAQKLANQCCETWGHDPWPSDPEGMLRSCGATKEDQAICRRCGLILR